METIPLLRDIDDEKHYAQLLEVAYVEAWVELRQVLTDAKIYGRYKPGLPSPSYELKVNVGQLVGLKDVMENTVQQSVDRRRRLADVARRLADVVLDEEGSEE